MIGMGLIFLGALDCMLSWRGGLTISGLYILFIAAGVMLFAAGSIRGSQAGKIQRTKR